MNYFSEDLAFSIEQADEEWWRATYQEAFHDFAGMRYVQQDGWAQRGGIDRQVFLSGGQVLNIDEKTRRNAWPDIAIEFFSSIEQQTPGWIAKSLAIDYLAYAFLPTRRCFLLPWPTLRRAWKLYCKEWVQSARKGRDGFKIVRAQNPGYTTVSVAVPIPILLDAVGNAMIVDVPSL